MPQLCRLKIGCGYYLKPASYSAVVIIELLKKGVGKDFERCVANKIMLLLAAGIVSRRAAKLNFLFERKIRPKYNAHQKRNST